jgi:acetylornithine aminotransferase
VTSDKVVRLLPPLIMKRSEAEQAVNLVCDIIRDFVAA